MPKNNTKFVLIIGLLILILTGGIYYFAKNNKKNTTTTKSDVTQTNITPPSNRFGFAGPSSPIDNFEKIKALGAKYARGSIEWKKIEPTKDNYNFGLIGENGSLSQYNLELIPRLKLSQFWATECDTSLCSKNKECPAESADCPPKDLGNWSDQGYSPELYEVVYKSLENSLGKANFEYLIVGNEANSLLFWNGTAEQYQKTLATVYKAVKDFNSVNNTSYKVLDSGIASIIGPAIVRENYCSNNQTKKVYALEFANRYYARMTTTKITDSNIGDYLDCANPDRSYLILKSIFKKETNLQVAPFDILAYHYYEPWDTQEEVINWMKAEMKKNGYDAKPIMNTEGGYRDTLHLYSNTPTLAQDVADEIPKLHVVAFANNVLTWLWLPFTERETKPFYGAEWKGLIGTNQQELPAYQSYKTMVAKLSGLTSIDRLTEFKDTYVYKANFSNKDPLYIAWSSENSQIDFKKIDGKIKITKTDNSSTLQTSSKVDLNTSPIYIEKD